jgi:hypothetical protein
MKKKLPHFEDASKEYEDQLDLEINQDSDDE